MEKMNQFDTKYPFTKSTLVYKIGFSFTKCPVPINFGTYFSWSTDENKVFVGGDISWPTHDRKFLYYSYPR